jgi:hypothetical protein
MNVSVNHNRSSSFPGELGPFLLVLRTSSDPLSTAHLSEDRDTYAGYLIISGISLNPDLEN